jgi:endonuclease YncB( thermonuclease family)|tara:strand:+ start:448 stop:927 length:480 start_codon:yes stop_codon:yes gene_type:complete
MFLNKRKAIFPTSILSLVLFLTFNHVNSQELKIVDGDTIHFKDEKIRFTGIDAPELKQTCIKDDSKNFCGETAKQMLINKIGNNDIECISEGKDQYKRTLAECFVNNESLSSYLVKSGYAFAYRKYSKKFIKDENYAKTKKIGMWSMKFEFPWDYRRNN